MSLKTGELNIFPRLGGNLSALVERPVDALRALSGHPHKYSNADVERAKGVVARFGNRGLPVMINDGDGILSGAVFVEAARALGRKTIRVIVQSGLTDTEALLFGTAISKIQTLGSLDGEAMEAALLTFERDIEDFSAGVIGFAPGELDRLIGASTFAGEADKIPKLQTKPVSWPRALWQCGDHLVLCGDATSEKDLYRVLGDERISVALNDPPFGCKVDGFVAKKGAHREFVQGSGEMSDEELRDFFARFCQTLATALKPGALVYLFIDWRSLFLLQHAAEPVFGKPVNLCVWAKDRAGMGSFYRSQHELVLVQAMSGASHRNNIELGRHGRDRSNVWNWPCAASSRKGREGDMLKGHPTPKPVEMIAEAIIDSSVRGEIVYDGFLGSGTTLIAAERTQRIFRGMDLDPLYVDLAVRRWQDWTGKQAIDIDSGRSFNDIAMEGDHG